MKRITVQQVYEHAELYQYFRRWTQKHGLPQAKTGTTRHYEQVCDFTAAYNQYYRICPNEKPLFTKQKWRNKPWAISSSNPIGWAATGELHQQWTR